MRFLMLNWRDPENPLAGGAERVTQGYLEALSQRGHDVFWFANQFPGADQEKRFGGITVLRGGGKGTSILEARRWYRRQPRFDLVIDQHHGIPWYAPWWCRTNCVAYIHEVLGPIWDAFYQWPWNWIGKTQEEWTHRLYRHVPFWTACESTRDCLLSHGVRDISIIRYGVHTVALEVLPEKPLEQTLRLAVVSRLAPNKRIDHALEALRIVLSQGIKAQLKIVGTGEYEPRIRQIAATLPSGSVEFAGSLKEAEKDALLRDAHFLLHTSQREGWGLNIIEANAMGTPAVVYPVAGLRESTLHNRTGLVAARETPRALADCIIHALSQSEHYQRMRIQARDRARRFHWSEILPKACDWLEAHARGERPIAVPEE